jgi:hypothetical protein
VGEQKTGFWSWWKMYGLAAALGAVDGCNTPQKEILVVLAQRPTLAA